MPFEVFSTAARLSESSNSFNVFLVAESERPIIARGGYSVNPKYGFNRHPNIDVLIVAGGIHTAELRKSHVIRWVAEIEKSAQVVASVCTGAFILAEAGLLSNLNLTTHWEDIADLRRSYPSLKVLASQRWVDEGKYVTSGGISAGIDMSLHLVSRIENIELAQMAAKQMEFEWTKNP